MNKVMEVLPTNLETEVFRLVKFEKNVQYAFAMKTRTEGKWPKEKHFTTNRLEILGEHLGSKRWGYGDNSGGSEMFEFNGKVTEITYDYEGMTCFVPLGKK
jgi:hypothetical protein